MGDDFPVGPCGVEIDAVDTGDQVDTKGGISQLDDLVLFDEVVAVQPQAAKAELSEAVHESGGIAGVRPNPDVQVTGMAGAAMESHGIAPDHEVFNPVAV